MIEISGGSKPASMVFGVACHYLLEGTTLGLQTDETSALALFIAILIHGCLLSFAISLTLGFNSYCLIYFSYSF